MTQPSVALQPLGPVPLTCFCHGKSVPGSLAACPTAAAPGTRPDQSHKEPCSTNPTCKEPHGLDLPGTQDELDNLDVNGIVRLGELQDRMVEYILQGNPR